MADATKMICVLEMCRKQSFEMGLKGAFFDTETIDQIIAMLKEQEAVEPIRDEQTGRLWLCGNCGSYVGFEDNDPYDPNEYDKYCRECGKPVLWKGR